MNTSAHAPDAAQYLTFLLGDDVFAMDIRTVREIIQCGPMTPVPLVPDFVRGVINLRGSVVPVIDLHVRFGRPAASAGKRSCIVIFDAERDGERIPLGLLVDAVSAVVEIGADAIEPPPPFGAGVQRDFIHAMARVAQRFVVILEPAKAFDFDDGPAQRQAALAA